MTQFLFPPLPHETIAVAGHAERLAPNRIICAGRNYEDHAKEMGATVDREAPFFFLKGAYGVVQSGATIPYAAGTQNFHYEMELAVIIGADAFRISPQDALSAVFGYACALDMTRRDLQLVARDKGRPWDFGKNFEYSTVISEVIPASQIGHPSSGAIELRQNGELRQASDLSLMVWNVAELIADLSKYYHLRPGDVVLTGTPAGVGPVQPGDLLTGSIAGVGEITVRIGAPD